ncbi:MAG: SDR family NAD(P)-dependent oxidoreductase [Microbacteriaceae bacterium]
MGWDPAALPDQSGKIMVVTGGNRGIGYFAGEQLAGAGARVILACRNPENAEAATRAIRARVPGADVATMILDTSDLGSVHSAAEQLLALDRLDVLIENAGTVHPPRRRTLTADGNELVLATNVLGHFALAALTMPALRRTPGSRVVTLGSMATRLINPHLDDLQLERGYTAWRAYAQSKVAMQVFGFELDRRLTAAGADVSALVAHPGYAIGGRSPGIRGVNEPSRAKRFRDNLQAAFAQGKDDGAWPIVRAAIDPDAAGSSYWGPRFLNFGEPTQQTPTRVSLDPDAGSRLFEAAERYTRLTFPV